MSLSSDNSQLFFNARTNKVLRLPVGDDGLCELVIDHQVVRLPVKALELLHYHLVLIEPIAIGAQNAPLDDMPLDNVSLDNTPLDNMPLNDASAPKDTSQPDEQPQSPCRVEPDEWQLTEAVLSHR